MAELDSQFPRQRHPWLLLTPESDDVVAYVDVEAIETYTSMLASAISNKDGYVFRFMRLLRNKVGGTVEDDDCDEDPIWHTTQSSD